MPTPTQQVTDNAQAFLGSEHSVVVAMRVAWGGDTLSPPRRSPRTGDRRPSAVVGLRRLVRSLGHRLRPDPSRSTGILALTADEDRILMASDPARPKIPLEVLTTFRRSSPLVPDVVLMEEQLLPSLTIGARAFRVNGIDFTILLRAVEAGVIDSPDLRAALPRLKGAGRRRT